MNLQPLVEQYRGNILENVHLGLLCGVNDKKELISEIGNAQHVTFLRSAAKPFQAIPVVKAGVPKKLGLTSGEAALFAASQRGEAYQIEALESILKKADIAEELLLPCPTVPLNDEPRADFYAKGLSKRRIYHNCSGKHLGIIALCKELGYPVDTYWSLDNPVQQSILDTLSYMTEVPRDEIKIAVDGCGFPVFGIPLQALAVGYLKLACPDLIEDEATREAVIELTGYMNASPNMIASHGFICSSLLEDSNIVAKGGAKGVYAFGLKKERMAFALKVIDGAEPPWATIVASVLEQIGYDNQATIDRMYALTPKEIVNDNQAVVGENRAVFRLFDQ